MPNAQPDAGRISKRFDRQAKIVKVNIDQEPALARQFNVSSIPMLAFVIRGEVVGQSAGLPSESELSSVVEQLISMN